MENKEAINPKNLMTVVSFAIKKGVERQTVYNWIKQGKIKKVKYLTKSFVDTSSFKV